MQGDGEVEIREFPGRQPLIVQILQRLRGSGPDAAFLEAGARVPSLVTLLLSRIAGEQDLEQVVNAAGSPVAPLCRCASVWGIAAGGGGRYGAVRAGRGAHAGRRGAPRGPRPSWGRPADVGPRAAHRLLNRP